MRPAGALAALAASEAAAAPTLDDRIQSVFGPVADTLSGFVFVEVPLPGGLSAPLIVLWLAAAACLFTVYFRFIQVRGFMHAIQVVRGHYSNPKMQGEVSPFQALTTAVSGTVGTGNFTATHGTVTSVSAGANQVHGISFGLNDPTTAENAALRQRNEALAAEVEDLKTGRDAIEERAQQSRAAVPAQPGPRRAPATASAPGGGSLPVISRVRLPQVSAMPMRWVTGLPT